MALWAESKVVWKWGKAAGDGGPRLLRLASGRCGRPVWDCGGHAPPHWGRAGCAWLAPVCKGVWPAKVDGTPAAGVGWPPPPGMCGRPALASRGRRHAVPGGQGPPQPGTRWRPALAGRGRRRASCGGRGTTTARHPRAPRSGPPRSTTRRPRGSGTAAARHTRAPPIGPAEVARQHAAEKGGEVKNGACHLSRNNA